MRKFVISDNDAGQRLDKFASKAVKAMPLTLMYKYIRIKRIKVNGKRADIFGRGIFPLFYHCYKVVHHRPEAPVSGFILAFKVNFISSCRNMPAKGTFDYFEISVINAANSG